MHDVFLPAAKGMESAMLDFETVALIDDEKCIEIIDQTKLPNEEVYLRVSNLEEYYDAIYRLVVRGAPAIGVFAGFAVYLEAERFKGLSFDDFIKELSGSCEYLNSSRPTAVNLSWAIGRMLNVAKNNSDKSVSDIVELLKKESVAIKEEDTAMCFSIGENALQLVKKGDGLLTHCNAGQLATSKYGTATAVMYLGKERGYNFRVFSDETRPLLQGARLTSYELNRAGIDVTVICDNMASVVMKNGWINAVFVGADRIASNGDAANKIGTSGVAILAKHYGIPFYVCAPSSTIDASIASGDDIPIEERKGSEITTMWYEKPMAPEGVKTFNPAFDVTDHSLITAIITEKGINYPPYNFAN